MTDRSPSRARRSALRVASLVATLALAGCGSFDGAGNRVVGFITPYKAEVVQGNFVSKEQVAALQPGMSRLQVRDILGTPLLTSVFHADRWDYVFTLRRQNVEPQAYKLAVFFKGDALERFEGDDMPSESEFVSRLTSSRTLGKVPVLEATEETLNKYPGASAPASREPVAAPATSYPPLENPAR